jgi:hypothetical protein
LIHVEQAKIGRKNRKQMEKSHIIDDRDHVHVVMDGWDSINEKSKASFEIIFLVEPIKLCHSIYRGYKS